jgi:hypothetical protein
MIVPGYIRQLKKRSPSPNPSGRNRLINGPLLIVQPILLRSCPGNWSQNLLVRYLLPEPARCQRTPHVTELKGLPGRSPVLESILVEPEPGTCRGSCEWRHRLSTQNTVQSGTSLKRAKRPQAVLHDTDKTADEFRDISRSRVR